MSTPSRRLRMAQAAASTSPGAYEWSDATAVDRIYFGNMEADDYTFSSSILGLSFTPRPPADTQAWSLQPQQPGPNNLKGVRSAYYRNNNHADGSAQTALSVPSSFDVSAGTSFSILFQTKSTSSHRGATSRVTVFDLASFDITYAGVEVNIDPSSIAIYVKDDASVAHTTTWTHGGSFGWKDDIFYTWRLRFDRSQTKVTLSYKQEGSAWVDVPAGSLTLSGTALSSLGAITFSTTAQPNLAFFGNSYSTLPISGSYGYHGNLYQWAFAKNLTYLPTTLP